jgi:hypothetical protein
VKADVRDSISVDRNIHTCGFVANGNGLNHGAVRTAMVQQVKGNILAIDTLSLIVPLVTAEIGVTVIFNFGRFALAVFVFV